MKYLESSQASNPPEARTKNKESYPSYFLLSNLTNQIIIFILHIVKNIFTAIRNTSSILVNEALEILSNLNFYLFNQFFISLII